MNGQASLDAKGWKSEEVPAPQSTAHCDGQFTSSNESSINNSSSSNDSRSDQHGVDVKQAALQHPHELQAAQVAASNDDKSLVAAAGGSSGSSSPQAPPSVKYKVMSLEDGVLTLGEENDGLVESKPVSQSPSSGATSSSASSRSESSPDISALLRPEYAMPKNAVQPVTVGPAAEAAAAAADAEQQRIAAGNWGQGGGPGGDGNRSSGVFGAGMSDAEAAEIAGGPFMGFSNEMRVSI